MRISVTLDNAQVRALDAMSKVDKRSRAALIRAAIDQYIAKRRSTILRDSFGLWGDRRVDGLAYQRRVRSAW